MTTVSEWVIPGVYSILFLTWVIEFCMGRTLWISVQSKMLTAYIIFFAILIILYVNYTDIWDQSFLVLCISPILLIALGSDAIANSRRWMVLLPAILLVWIVAISAHMVHQNIPRDGELFQVPYSVYVYSLIGLLAAGARLFFVRTKHIMHTSLDYPPIRLEILSLGMKRPLAIGIKRKTDPALGVNNATN